MKLPSATRTALIAIAAIMLAGAGIASIRVLKQSPPAELPEPVIQVTPSVDITYPGTVEFRSDALGIAFNYREEKDGETFKTSESGNRVYVYMSKMKPQQGQWVEVFSKEPGQSLEQAVKEKFLAGKKGTDCWVVDTTANFDYSPMYKTAEITYPKPTGGDDPWFAGSEKCSVDYAQTNGMRYFQADFSRPDKFIFVSIGQYAIPAGENLSWQDTIRFLD